LYIYIPEFGPTFKCYHGEEGKGFCSGAQISGVKKSKGFCSEAYVNKAKKGRGLV
jgi:hypothetical protein